MRARDQDGRFFGGARRGGRGDGGGGMMPCGQFLGLVAVLLLLFVVTWIAFRIPFVVN